MLDRSTLPAGGSPPPPDDRDATRPLPASQAPELAATRQMPPSSADLEATLDSHPALHLEARANSRAVPATRVLAPSNPDLELTLDSHPSIHLPKSGTRSGTAQLPGSADHAETMASSVEIDLAHPSIDNGRLPKVPGFAVLQAIGRGGMGVVYKARQLGVNRPVALKMLKSGEFTAPDQAIRFRLEGEIAARVDHANVVRVYETGVVDNQPFLVMEWVDGGTLADLLAERKLTARESAALCEALARGAFACHVNGIVHRDLKPANVLLARASTATTTVGASAPTLLGFVPKLTDFGIAKELGTGDGMTETGMVIGTAEYMSPEQAAGRGKTVGPPADVYALGVILQTMFGAAEMPRRLQAVSRKAMSAQRTGRYASARELADDIVRFLDGAAMEAYRENAFERLARWLHRNRALITVVAAYLIMRIIVFLWIRR